MELKLSKNNAKETIERAEKITPTFYFQKYCPADIQINVYTKLVEAFNMIGDRANADKYANEIKKNKVLLSFKNFRKLELPESNVVNAEEAIKLASVFVENQYFLEICPEKIRNDIYAKLAKAYYLKDEYGNAYKYLCKNTGIFYLDERENYKYQSQVCIFDDKFRYYQKNYQQREELTKICYHVYYKCGYLSEAEYEQYINSWKEGYFRTLLKNDFNKMCSIEFEWVLERFEKIDLSKKNKKDVEEVFELASKFMNIPIFNERYDKLPMSDIYGKLGEAYYIVGEYCSAIINLAKTGRLEEGGKFKELYDKSCDGLPKIYMAIKEIEENTKYKNPSVKALKEDPLNFDRQ